MAPGGFACSLDAPTVVLAPGEVRAATYLWKGDRYDPASGEHRPAPPGIYHVYGGLDAMHFNCPSEPVPIELLPR